MEVLIGGRKNISKFSFGGGVGAHISCGGGAYAFLPYAFCFLVQFMQCVLDSRFQYMHLE